MWSASELLEQVSGDIPSFVDRSALAGCIRIAKGIPHFASSFYLECRLDDDAQVDLLAYTRNKAMAAAMEDELPVSARSRCWQQNLGLLREWSTGSSDLARAPCIWFEYDDGANAGETPEASLSIGLEARYYRRHIDPQLQFDGLAARRLANAALRQLLPSAQHKVRLNTIDTVLTALPARGAVGYVSVTTARLPVMVKLYVIIPRGELARFLRDIRWPGNAATLQQELVTYYSAFHQTVCLDLTLSDRVEPRLGLATSQFQRHEVGPARKSLDWLILPRRYSAAKAALATWPGVMECQVRGQRVWVRRWLDTKAVINTNDVSYKAYLGFMPVVAPPLLWNSDSHARDSSRTPPTR